MIEVNIKGRLADALRKEFERQRSDASNLNPPVSLAAMARDMLAEYLESKVRS
jgi:hypothetical protein